MPHPDDYFHEIEKREKERRQIIQDIKHERRRGKDRRKAAIKSPDQDAEGVTT